MSEAAVIRSGDLTTTQASRLSYVRAEGHKQKLLFLQNMTFQHKVFFVWGSNHRKGQGDLPTTTGLVLAKKVNEKELKFLKVIKSTEQTNDSKVIQNGPETMIQ